MDDRELLEQAAKAAIGAGMDITLHPWESIDPFAEGVDYMIGDEFWNPLEDDGDALRLAAELRDVTVVIDNHMNWCGIHLTAERGKYDLVEYFNGDRPRSIRLAIVRAAAEIGRSMP